MLCETNFPAHPTVVLDVAFLGHAHGTHRGAERVVRRLFDGLRASNWCELTFVASSHLAGTYDFLESQGIDVDRKFRHSSLQLTRSRLTEALSEMVHRSIENRSLPARGGRYALAQLARVLAHGESHFRAKWIDRAQIYHSPHTPFPTAVQKNRHLRKFITCHDLIPLKNPDYFHKNFRYFMDGVLACLQPDNFAFCVSETTRNDVLTFSRMPPERVFVTPLAADERIFHPVQEPEKLLALRRRYSIGDEPYFLALSAHDRHKNFTHLIECFGALVEAGELKGYNLAIAGPNPERKPEVQAAIAKFPKAAKQIRVTGYIADEDLAALYSGAVAFLFPSLAEGFGIPPLEAMHCGLPVIASNTTSMPEVIGDAGVLLPPTDRDAWCEAMLQVTRDENLREEYAKRGLARAKLFSWQRFIDATIRGYQASLERF